MSKYIIKNCPAYYINTCSDSKVKEQYCSKCTDCVMKQIVQVCNEYSDKWEDCDFSNGLSDEIFNLLQIEEVE